MGKCLGWAKRKGNEGICMGHWRGGEWNCLLTTRFRKDLEHLRLKV
jgi:hypothetical protein